MTFTYDLGGDAGRVRLLIPDTDETNALYADEEVAAFLELEGDVRSAAALALETAASSEAMVSKVIRTQDLATDGVKVAGELRARAAQLRVQASEAAQAAADGGGLDIVDFDPWQGYRGYVS